MHKHCELLERIGKTREIAQAIGIVDPHVSKWKRSGIPNKYVPAIVKLARLKGIEPKLCDFYDV